jgi:NitT/TauT family transport system substrate-binding protein
VDALQQRLPGQGHVLGALNGSAVVVGKHVEAKDFADLGGKQVAVPYWYSMHNIVLQMGCATLG